MSLRDRMKRLFGERTEPEPPDEVVTIITTPWSARVHELHNELGLSGVALVRALQQVEIAMVEKVVRVMKKTPRRTRYMSTPMAREKSTKKRPTARRRKWREIKRNQRAKLRLVHPGKDAS